jgi:hypothetical protein
MIRKLKGKIFPGNFHFLIAWQPPGFYLFPPSWSKNQVIWIKIVGIELLPDPGASNPKTAQFCAEITFPG